MASIADEYEPLEVIGKGSFGTVRKVRQRDNGAILVRKEIEYTSMNLQERNHIISELRILRELNHPHIVKYLRHDHVPDKKAIHIYQEYCDGGDLGQVISTFKKNAETVPEEFIWEVLVQTLLALHKCHYGVDSKKVNLFSGSAEVSSEPAINSETVIIHRDIKPENIFLLDSRKTIKLGDFGLAKMLTSSNDFAKTYVGTPYYMSPEVLMDNPYSPVCDIWSLGCVLFELCNLSPPFQAKTHLQLQTRIRHGKIPEISEVYSQPLRNIIRDSITVDPELRPTCHELLETLSIKMFRKEMELREFNDTLKDFQSQLIIKSNELKKRESNLHAIEERENALKMLERQVNSQKAELERKVSTQKLELERQMHTQKMELERQMHTQKLEADRQIAIRKKELEHDYNSLQKKLALQREELEKELVEEFEMRKRIMDQEGKDLRLYYQREFKHVVEQGVQARLSEILAAKKSPSEIEGLVRKKSNSSSSSMERKQRAQPTTKPKGPRELSDERPIFSTQTPHLGINIPNYSHNGSHQPSYQSYQPSYPPSHQSHQSHQSQQYSSNSKALGSPQRRTPLRSRNTEPDIETCSTSPTRPNLNVKKRITDEFERLHLQKRNTPEFEEQYMRQNRRFES